MKHLTTMTKPAPRKANAIQDFICTAAFFVDALLGSFGGAAPILSFTNEKCDLPTPGGEGQGDGAA